MVTAITVAILAVEIPCEVECLRTCQWREKAWVLSQFQYAISLRIAYK